MTQTNFDPPRVLVADLFCGAGGSSTGAKKAINQMGAEMELVAVNHWQTAIETHQANHPDARHVVEDVSIVNPESVVEEGRLDILMASPECTGHSRARGGKPIHDQGRMAPFAIFNWLTRLNVKTVLIENVPEFKNWGPLDEDDQPIEEKRGEFFQAWYFTFANLGYQAEWRMLNAADYGDATTRTRFFLIARKDGIPIQWPEPTHAKQDTPLLPGRKPWRGANEIIDWSEPGHSIFERRKPLVPNTLKRIARGLERYGGPLAPLFIRLLDLPDQHCIACTEEEHALEQQSVHAFIINRHGENGSPRIHTVSEPCPTSTTRGAGYLVQAAAQPFQGANRNGNRPRHIDEPLPPATTAPGGGLYLAEALAQPFLLGQQSCAAPRDTEQPAPTISTAGAISVVEPVIILYYGNSNAQSCEHPVAGITAKGGKHGLIQPIIVRYHGASDASHPDDPLPGLTTKDRHGLASPALLQVNHGNGRQGDRGNDRRVQSLEYPVPAITTKHGLAITTPEITPSPYIVPQFGERDGQLPRVHDVMDPTPAVTSHGAGSLVTPTISQIIEDIAKDQSIDPRRVILVNDLPHILDIRFRMLMNSELARAMGFNDHDTRYEFFGNKTEVTKQIGNAVAVNTAAALVGTILAPTMRQQVEDLAMAAD